MTMGIGLFSRSAVTPASFSFDVAADAQIDHQGPYKVSLVACTDTADPAAGVLSFSMTHRAPNGSVTDVLSPLIVGNLILSDPNNYFSTAQDCIVRLDGSSLWTLDAVLTGSAGTSKASYWFIVEPIESTDFSDIGAGVTP
jgi:hypothetical protein